MESTAAEKPYTFRPYTTEDIAFIQHSWGQSYYDGVNGHKQLPPPHFHKAHRPLRDKIFLKPTATAIVCVSKEDQNLIIGWILLEAPEDENYQILHYIYVKHAFQGEGIAKELADLALRKRPILYTHSTIQARMIIKNTWKANKQTFERWLYTPHLI